MGMMELCIPCFIVQQEHWLCLTGAVPCVDGGWRTHDETICRMPVSSTLYMTSSQGNRQTAGFLVFEFWYHGLFNCLVSWLMKQWNGIGCRCNVEALANATVCWSCRFVKCPLSKVPLSMIVWPLLGRIWIWGLLELVEWYLRTRCSGPDREACSVCLFPKPSLHILA